MVPQFSTSALIMLAVEISVVNCKRYRVIYNWSKPHREVNVTLQAPVIGSYHIVNNLSADKYFRKEESFRVWKANLPNSRHVIKYHLMSYFINAIHCEVVTSCGHWRTAKETFTVLKYSLPNRFITVAELFVMYFDLRFSFLGHSHRLQDMTENLKSELTIKQECIPVGCVPPAHWPTVSRGIMLGGTCVACNPP